ncbi:MAG: hypothetical protein MJ252_18985 [archaeon]|nr:hypothetical protein [archaeon]
MEENNIPNEENKESPENQNIAESNINPEEEKKEEELPQEQSDQNNQNNDQQEEMPPAEEDNNIVPQTEEQQENNQTPQENENNQPENNQEETPKENQPEEDKKEVEAKGDLIYDNEDNFHEMGKLFDDENDKEEYDTYEIEFKIIDSKQNPMTVLIELEKIKYKKPYYGGYVNKNNGAYFYHAYAQTDQYKNNHIIKNERSAQTYEYRTLSTKMHREFGTQMSYIGLYIDNRQDKIRKPRKYFEAEQWENKRDATVKYLQKMMRGFFARKTCKQLRKERDDEKAEIERKEEELRQKQEKKNKEEIKRRMHPKSANDFKLLKQELDEWVRSETIRIKASDLSDEDKSLALQELLHKEISLLQTIEKLKITANKENRTDQIASFLEKMSADKKWKVYDGHHVNVQTILTATAAGLQKQFKKLIASTTVDQRLANLLEFKQMMMKSNEGKNACTLIDKIIDLIDRESILLERGRPDSSLEGLRQRLNNLYLNYIETPEFNPEAQRFQIIPKNYLMNMFKSTNN